MILTKLSSLDLVSDDDDNNNEEEDSEDKEEKDDNNDKSIKLKQIWIFKSYPNYDINPNKAN